MDKVRTIEEKKYMWDGRMYESDSEANAVKQEYEKNAFETHLVQEDGHYFLFTRKVVTEIKIA